MLCEWCHQIYLKISVTLIQLVKLTKSAPARAITNLFGFTRYWSILKMQFSEESLTTLRNDSSRHKTRILLPLPTPPPSVYAYTHRHTHTHTYTHTHTRTCAHTHIHKHMCAHTRTWCQRVENCRVKKNHQCPQPIFLHVWWITPNKNQSPNDSTLLFFHGPS